MVRLNPKTAEKVQRWQAIKAELRAIEKQERELNKELREEVKAALARARINDPSHPVRVGQGTLRLEQIAATYGAVITQEQVGTRPMTRRAYETLKAGV